MVQVKCIAQWPLQKLQSQCSINYTRIVAAAVALVIQVVVSEVGIVSSGCYSHAIIKWEVEDKCTSGGNLLPPCALWYPVVKDNGSANRRNEGV